MSFNGGIEQFDQLFMFFLGLTNSFFIIQPFKPEFFSKREYFREICSSRPQLVQLTLVFTCRDLYGQNLIL